MSKARFGGSILGLVLCLFCTSAYCEAQIGYATPTPTITTGAFGVTSTAATQEIRGTINGYTGNVRFGLKAAGPFTIVSDEGNKNVSIRANPAGGVQLWDTNGGIAPGAGVWGGASAWSISPVPPGMPNSARWPDHGVAWTRYGTQYASIGGCTVYP